MRIAYVIAGGMDRSGRERVIPVLLSLVERQARRHHVSVYVLRYHATPCSYELVGATVHDLGRPAGLARQYRATIAALRRDGPFDVIHGYWALPAGLVAALAGRRLRIPSVVTFSSGEVVSHPDLQYGLQGRWRSRLGVAATMRLATRLTACTQFQARLTERHGRRPDVIPWGVDTSIFTPALREEGPPWRLLHVASLNRIKEQSMLIDAMNAIVARQPTAHLDIVGEDTLNGAIQSHAHRSGLDAHVTFHGFLPTDRLVPLYQRAHLLVMSSRHEAAGVSVLEAAACGVPVAGTAVGYLADWTPDRAVSVPPRDAAALAKAVLALLEDKPARDQLAAAARTWTLTHDVDWTAAKLTAIYSELRN